MRGEAPETADDALRIRLLGDFEVRIGERRIPSKAWRSKKAATLIKLLALAPNHRLHREQILDLLWPDQDPSAATNNLYYTLHTARGLLDGRSGASPYLVLSQEMVVLHRGDTVWTDVEAFEEAVAGARRLGSVQLYARAADRYGGDLLPHDVYEDWVVPRREHLRSLYHSSLLELAELQVAEGSPADAVETLERAIASDPTLEGAHAALIRLLVRVGQRQRALRQYEIARRALRQEVDAEPGHELELAYREALERAPMGPSDERARAPASDHNLPTQLNTFVGRERDIAEVVDRLGGERPLCRLVTLTGAGGVGKTRLALQAAGALRGFYGGGVWFIDLANAANEAHVVETVAAVLIADRRSATDLRRAVAERIGSSATLLIMDNCEQVVAPVARLVEELLASCPRLAVLATSREALRVSAESRYLVPSLEIPAQGVAVEELVSMEAVRLFIDRARLCHPSFTVTRANAAAVIAVCRHLDGLPLAIELAAARAGSIALDVMAERLQESVTLLTGGLRTVPRQQTMQAALDWSHHLLNGEEQALFRRLSVFSGGWTLEVAEHVVGDDPDAVLERLPQLVEKSLVLAEMGAEGAIRYRYLEPIRQYARRRLQIAGDMSYVQERHAAWYLRLAELGEERIQGGQDQGRWVDRLEEEHNNLRVALQWAVDNDAVIALRLAGALWRFWVMTGHFTEGRRWVEAALAVGVDCAAEYRARALNALGRVYWDSGQNDLAISVLRESVALCGENHLEIELGQALNNLGLALWTEREYAQAQKLFGESLTIRERLGDKLGVSHALTNLGNIALELGQFSEARDFYERSLALDRALQNRVGVGGGLGNLALVVMRQGDLQRAVQLLEESRDVGRSTGDRSGYLLSTYNLGWGWMRLGEYERALASFRESVSLSRETGQEPVLLAALDGIASALTQLGQVRPAARAFGALLVLEEKAGVRHSPQGQKTREEMFSAASTLLGPDAFGALLAEGRNLPADTLADFLLDLPSEEGASVPVEGLTERESQVALLVAEGLTNQQIGARLGLSTRTIDTHVGRILRKLGFASRAQIAAKIAAESPSSAQS